MSDVSYFQWQIQPAGTWPTGQSIFPEWQQFKYFKTDPLPEGSWGVATLLSRKAAVSPNHLDSIPRLYFVHQIIIQNDIHRAGQLAGGGLLWHLLDSDGLMVFIYGKAIFCLKGIVFFILETETQKRYLSPVWKSHSSLTENKVFGNDSVRSKYPETSKQNS